ncbi:MAG: hypothetical protein QOC87_1075, partial [Actinomycetota bacterium]|nr:hypothetical protein [Actinomycetota bacterium]
MNAPDGFDKTLGPLPDAVQVLKKPGKEMDVLVFFTASKTELRRRFGSLAQALAPNGGLWIGWPKKASKIATDLSEQDVRDIGLDEG